MQLLARWLFKAAFSSRAKPSWRVPPNPVSLIVFRAEGGVFVFLRLLRCQCAIVVLAIRA
jgi:hypothetical protein